MKTSTQIERDGLLGTLNLTDGHARQSPTKGQSLVIAKMGDIFTEAERTPIDFLERRFVECFFQLAKEIILPEERLMFAYSSSCSIAIVSKLLSQRNYRVGLLSPCFDNIHKLVTWFNNDLKAVSEDEMVDSNRLSAILSEIDSLWITLPNNPTGFCLSQSQFEVLVEKCNENDVLLVVDLCFRFFNREFDHWSIYDVLETSQCSYATIEDTGKTFKTLDMKIGFTGCSENLESDLFKLYDDLLLSVSEFHLLFLSEMIEDAKSSGIAYSIRDLIQSNRNTIAPIYGSSLLSRGSAHLDNTPLEWIKFNSDDGENLSNFLAKCRESGLHMLPGDNFFWNTRKHDGDYFRIPLNRNPSDILLSAEIIQSHT